METGKVERSMMSKHPSHKTRSSDASYYDEVCINCGATDIAGAGWGKLADPCPKATGINESSATPQNCPGCTVMFDESEATKLSTSEIRRRYPRFEGECGVCGFIGIRYASMAHYRYGDW